MFKYFFKKRTPIRLGRWEHRLNDNQIKIKNILSNHDHCGDKICQYPLNINRNLKQKVKKISELLVVLIKKMKLILAVYYWDFTDFVKIANY